MNGNAPIVVMTTEVLRNMIYAESEALDGLRYVVLDEVHYLQNRYRGAVWEEVIIHLPPTVDLVCLSATVSNAEEFADWIRTVRGETTAIIEERRPVELTNLYAVGERGVDRIHLLPTFMPGPGGELRPNAEASRLDARGARPGCAGRAAVPGAGCTHRAAPSSSSCWPSRGCSRRSRSSSAAPRVTTRCASAWPRASGSPRRTSARSCGASPRNA